MSEPVGQAGGLGAMLLLGSLLAVGSAVRACKRRVTGLSCALTKMTRCCMRGSQ